MKKETIRRIDQLLGSLICALLTLHRRIFEDSAPVPPRSEGSLPFPRTKSERILFIKFIEQGATVLAFEALQRAVARVGAGNVYFVVFIENRPILDILDVIPAANIFVIRAGTFARFIADALATLRRIRAARIDTTIDMEFLTRASAIFGYLTGARRRVGLHRYTEEAPYRGDLMTHRVSYNPFLHCARSYRMLVDALDADPEDRPLLKVPADGPEEAVPVFAPTAEEDARLEALLVEVAGGRVAGPRVILNPNASDLLPLRKWPMERFVELGRRLLAEQPEATLLITGAPSERAASEELARAIGSPRAVSLAGRTTLREVLVLYGHCDVLVTNDSGPGHFATLTTIDNVVLFGPGSPRQYGPLGARNHVLYANLACSPCVNVYNHRFSPCVDNRCMQAISVEEVCGKVLACLAARAASRRGAIAR